MRPNPGEVLHFSEDPSIRRFAPHVAPTSAERDPYVWAVDAQHSPSYWFPRQCPRAMAWVGPSTTNDDRARILGPGAHRVHVIEFGWLPAMMSVSLYAYRLPASAFTYLRDVALVATTEVEPLGPAELVGDLLTLHDQARIQLRLVDNLHLWWDEVITSTVQFSGIRLRNARPRL